MRGVAEAYHDTCERCGGVAGVLANGVCSSCVECCYCGEWSFDLSEGCCLRCLNKFAGETVETVEKALEHNHQDLIEREQLARDYGCGGGCDD